MLGSTKKQPYYIHYRDNRPFAFAGLWESWSAKSTTAKAQRPRHAADDPSPSKAARSSPPSASKALASLHDRMPVILESGDYELWLDPEVQDPAAIAAPDRPQRRRSHHRRAGLDPRQPRGQRRLAVRPSRAGAVRLKAVRQRNVPPPPLPLPRLPLSLPRRPGGDSLHVRAICGRAERRSTSVASRVRTPIGCGGASGPRGMSSHSNRSRSRWRIFAASSQR